MSLAIYGEISLDVLVNSDSNIHTRLGGAGLYAAISAGRQECNVQFMTIYGPEVDEYCIHAWSKLGIAFDTAIKKKYYALPRYLVTGFRAFETKESTPMTNINLGIEYIPSINDECKGILIFPIDHDIPIEICIQAMEKNIPIFLDPKPNEKSILKARELLKYVTFLLVNEEEALLLSDESNLEDAIRSLSESGPKYTIIKRGHLGCIVVHKNKRTEFPAFKSAVQCTLGSGDAFDGAFAATYIATKNIEYSVKVAACVAASFIESFEIENVINKKGAQLDIETRKFCSYKSNFKEIYLASPFFTIQEKKWLNEVCRKLENVQFNVLSPSRENGIITKDTDWVERERIFRDDIALLDKADFMVALIDNNDSGTFFEIGYANKQGIPVFGLKTSTFDLNNMILFGCNYIASSVEELIEKIYAYDQ